jgi:hypothetical protein
MEINSSWSGGFTPIQLIDGTRKNGLGNGCVFPKKYSDNRFW